MTDSNLMEANCIHGVVWFECEKCCKQRPSVTIDYDPKYDEYAGAFIVTCGDSTEECMTIDDAFTQAKSLLKKKIEEV